jgi:hypothetical protein
MLSDGNLAFAAPDQRLLKREFISMVWTNFSSGVFVPSNSRRIVFSAPTRCLAN